MIDSLLKTKSKQFAMRIVNMCRFLNENAKEYILSKQIIRSGTSIGANIAEAIYAESDLDFIHKLSIARKEGSETLYWLEILYESRFIDERSFESMYADCEELMKLLTATIKTKKLNL